MKTLKINGGLLIMFLCLGIASYAQKSKPFTGIITYSIIYPDSAKLDANVKAALPVEMTTYITNDMKKNVIASSMANQVEILNLIDSTRTALIDIMGQKFAIKSTKEEVDKENAGKTDPVITYYDTTKVIAGYPCKKAIIAATSKDGKPMLLEVFFTKEISGKYLTFGSDFRGLDGFPLEFSTNEGRILMVFTATSVERSKLKKSFFEIPEGYKYVTKEELQNMFGGGSDM
jgi:GLPGLI family protein